MMMKKPFSLTLCGYLEQIAYRYYIYIFMLVLQVANLPWTYIFFTYPRA